MGPSRFAVALRDASLVEPRITPKAVRIYLVLRICRFRLPGPLPGEIAFWCSVAC